MKYSPLCVTLVDPAVRLKYKVTAAAVCFNHFTKMHLAQGSLNRRVDEGFAGWGINLFCSAALTRANDKTNYGVCLELVRRRQRRNGYPS
jgi:hypothetical protein